jgi:hypothetical protein
MFERYFILTLEHPWALDEVLWFGYIGHSLALIHNGCFYSSFGLVELTKVNIPLEYDIKNNDEHVSIKNKLQNMVLKKITETR